MSTEQAVGIWGLGTYVPETIRRNDWWPETVVARWREQMAHRITRSDAGQETIPDAARPILAAMAEHAHDPFRGAVERRVMSESMTTSEMEVHAAREAMTRAQVGPQDIDVILAQTTCPEQLMVNHACVAHRLLGAPRRCLALATEGTANAFALHASLAQALIRSGQARCVLSLQSSALTRVHGPEEPHSAWWGDGAAAAVFGAVSPGRGLLAATHHADGAAAEALLLGVPGKRWWEEGAITTYAGDAAQIRSMFLSMGDRSRDAIHASLEEASLTPHDVDFYAAHQATPWLARVTAANAGLDRASTIATFPSFANMNNVNVPFVLASGEREGLIRDDSVVATFSGGLGETWSSLVFRWGR